MLPKFKLDVSAVNHFTVTSEDGHCCIVPFDSKRYKIDISKEAFSAEILTDGSRDELGEILTYLIKAIAVVNGSEIKLEREAD